jgi:predicted amidohydrolase
MKIGYLQFNPEFGNVEANIYRIEKLLQDKNFDLLVLPELSNSGYLFTSNEELDKLSDKIPDGKYCNALKSICSEKKGFIVSGICEKDGNDFYNSAILIKPDGEIITYRKIQLFYEEKQWFKPGNIPLTSYEITGKNFGTVKIGMMVCFDWIFPEVARTLSLNGAQIICHPSNLVMPYCQDAMVTRALENHVFTITANRMGTEINGDKELSFTGMSEIVNPKGKILNKSLENEEGCVVIEIEPQEALNKNINPHNNLFSDRREEFYFK